MNSFKRELLVQQAANNGDWLNAAALVSCFMIEIGEDKVEEHLNACLNTEIKIGVDVGTQTITVKMYNHTVQLVMSEKIYNTICERRGIKPEMSVNKSNLILGWYC